MLEVILGLDKDSMRDRNDMSTMPVVVVRTDNALEYIFLRNKFREHGITLETIFTYMHYQIGIAERFNRIIGNIMRTMLSQLGLSMSFWSEAARYGNHLRNRLLYGVRGSKLLFERRYNKRPDLSKEKVFGCVCLVYIPKDKRESKLHPRGYEAIYIGYMSSTQYRVYDLRTNRMMWSTSVKFYEDRKGVDLLSQNALLMLYNTRRADIASLSSTDDITLSDVSPSEGDDILSDEDGPDDSMRPAAVTSSPLKIVVIEDTRDSSAEGELFIISLSATVNTSGNPLILAGVGLSLARELGDAGETSSASNTSSGMDSPDTSADLVTSPRSVSIIGRQSILATAILTRPLRTKKDYNSYAFYKNFGRKDRAKLVNNIVELLIYNEAINGSNA